MNRVDDFFLNSDYNIVRVLLSVNGLWPYQTRRKRYTIYVGILLIIGSGFLFEVLGVLEILNDSSELIDCSPMITLALLAFIKLLYAVHTLPKIKMLLVKVQEYCLSSKSKEELKIQHSYMLYTRKFSYIYTGLILCHVFIFNLMMLLAMIFHMKNKNGDKLPEEARAVKEGLPYPVNYLINTETYYIPIFIHTTMCDFNYMLWIIGFDVLYLMLVAHCCSVFASLRYRLENALELDDDTDGLTVTSLSKDKSYLNIMYSAKRHADVLQFIVIMESVHSLPLFIHVGLAVMVLSVVGFQVVTNTQNLSRTLKYSSYLSGLMFNIFFLNWQGQKIIDSSEKVYESAYNAKWYDMPMKTQKLLILIMMRSRKPMKLTAVKFFTLSYETFSAVLRTSSSYFMLLQNFNN